MSRRGKIREVLLETVGINELTLRSTLWPSLIAEFVGTGFLVLVACGSATDWSILKEKEPPEPPVPAPSIVEIALSFGLIVASMVQAICHVSGGHINPAVTIGMLVAGHCSILRAILYVIVQCGGAVLGSAILFAVTPGGLRGALGATKLHKEVNAMQGLTVEFLITFVLVFTVFGVCDKNRSDITGSAPLAIGLSITACHLWAIKLTGASMNTARSFGPAIIMGIWADHWIYWAGPLLGGIVAGLLYRLVMAAPAKDKQETKRESQEPLSEKDVEIPQSDQNTPKAPAK